MVIDAIRCGTRRTCPGSATGLYYLYLGTDIKFKKKHIAALCQVHRKSGGDFSKYGQIQSNLKSATLHFYVDSVYIWQVTKITMGRPSLPLLCPFGLTEREDPCPEHQSG